MELCCCSLHEVVTSRERKIPAAHQTRIVRELCEGVGYLHRHGIVHRDLRPKNILFKATHLHSATTSEGPDRGHGYCGTVKISDFGLSQDIQTSESGSQKYMSLSLAHTNF